jgi:hypothetical protein
LTKNHWEVTAMGMVRSERDLMGPDPALDTPWNTEREARQRPMVVAEVLSDGTVQILDRAAIAEE